MMKSEKRFAQLYDAALNLGMSESDAMLYAEIALERERLFSLPERLIEPLSGEANISGLY